MLMDIFNARSSTEVVSVGDLEMQIENATPTTSLEKLNLMEERKDKFVSKLFSKKVELLLEKKRNPWYPENNERFLGPSFDCT